MYHYGLFAGSCTCDLASSQYRVVEQEVGKPLFASPESLAISGWDITDLIKEVQKLER